MNNQEDKTEEINQNKKISKPYKKEWTVHVTN